MTFVFGIATTAAMGEVLPRWTTSLLKIQRFSLQVTMDLLAGNYCRKQSSNANLIKSLIELDVVDTLFIRGGGARPESSQQDVDVPETLGSAAISKE